MCLTSWTWKQTWQWAGLPVSLVTSIEDRVQSAEEGHQACATIYVSCSPKASWQHLSGRLYQAGELDALEKLKPFLPSKGSFCP